MEFVAGRVNEMTVYEPMFEGGGGRSDGDAIERQKWLQHGKFRKQCIRRKLSKFYDRLFRLWRIPWWKFTVR